MCYVNCKQGFKLFFIGIIKSFYFLSPLSLSQHYGKLESLFGRIWKHNELDHGSAFVISGGFSLAFYLQEKAR